MNQYGEFRDQKSVSLGVQDGLLKFLLKAFNVDTFYLCQTLVTYQKKSFMTMQISLYYINKLSKIYDTCVKIPTILIKI